MFILNVWVGNHLLWNRLDFFFYIYKSTETRGNRDRIMPVTATNENMEVDSDNNIGEASTSNQATNATPSTSNPTVATKSSNESSINSVMASPSTVPSVSVSLHPLVIMNISEHWTRIRAQNGSPQQGLIHYLFFPALALYLCSSHIL